MKRICAVVVVCFLAVPAVLCAATKTWNGSADNHWSNGANWDGGSAPVAGDDLVFSNPLNGAMVNDLPSGTAFHSLSFSHPYVISGNPLTITGGISNGYYGSPKFATPITLGGSQTWSGPIYVGETGGSVDLGPYTLTLAGNAELHCPISGSGGLRVTGSASLFGRPDVYPDNSYTGPTTVVSSGLFGCFSCTIPGAIALSGGLYFGRDRHAGVLPPISHTGPITSTGGILHLFNDGGACGNLSLDAASQVQVTNEVQGTFTPLSVSGTVSLGNARLSFTPSYLATTGTKFTLIDNDGADAVGGTFAGAAEGDYAAAAQQISYRGGSGNDVTLTLVPPPVPTTTTFTCSPNPSLTGQSVTLTATVTAAGAPSGSVSFFDNGRKQTLGTQPLISGKASLTIALTAGTHYLAAAFIPDTFLYSGSSAGFTQTVNPYSTTTSLQASLNPMLVGQRTTLRATVTSAGGTPSGWVDFHVDEIIWATVPLSGGTATVQVGPLAVGAHSVLAVFNSDTVTMEESVAPPLTLTVQPQATVIPTATSLVASPNPLLPGQPATLRATVTAAGSNPTGSVTFFDGSAVLATQAVSGGVAVVTAGPFSGGDHVLTAAYSPDATAWAASTSAPVALSVAAAPMATRVALAASPSPSVLAQQVTLTAYVTAAKLPLGLVLFSDGDVLLDSQPLTAGSVSITLSSLAAGTHELRAAFVPVSSVFSPSVSDVVIHEVIGGTIRRRASGH